MANVVTRFPNGLTNVSESNGVWGDHPAPAPTKTHSYFNDFDTYAAADWTVTETSAGATQAITNGDGGILLLTGVASSGTLVALDKVGESFTFESGKELFFETRFKVNETTLTDAVVGLQVTDSSPFAVASGVFFLKSSGSQNVVFIVEAASTASSTIATTIADDTYLQLGFHYDGGSRLSYSVAGSEVGTIATTNLPAAASTMTISFGVGSGSSGAALMYMDYVHVSKTR